ncbi:thiol:disulfide interchange protein DsbA [Luteimonas cucumeris]|uniref:Thiol:disulfide interchange protein DsbA n=1 Tax=Luteimonas cucumeris TaxID=985012 RepID=A0A562LEC8_9GAMM|nr:thiol:disulfide interchange protein DsbA/DsbL [Luteimonas cucumeris]TWI05916.1 thiol:disulfide interchange protein DsbA [Luteimonas cucumeris]
MTKRLALLLLALLPLIACQPQTPATDTTPAAAESVAAASNEPLPAGEPALPADAPVPAGTDVAATDAAPVEAASATPDAAPVANTPPASGDSLVAGVDYIEIPNGQPFLPLDGKVEVVEVFGYVCPACAQFQPLVNGWKTKLPANVRFTYVPAAFGGPWTNYAKAYYAAETLGLVERTHDDLFKAIHIDQTLKGERGQDSVADIAAFYGKHGVDPKQFASTLESFAVDAKLNRAKQWAVRSGLEGTPTIIVNGKYRVKGKTFPDMLRIADVLIARETAAANAG